MIEYHLNYLNVYESHHLTQKSYQRQFKNSVGFRQPLFFLYLFLTAGFYVSLNKWRYSHLQPVFFLFKNLLMFILILKRHKEAFISIWGQMNSFSLDSSSLDELSNRNPRTVPATDQRFLKRTEGVSGSLLSNWFLNYSSDIYFKMVEHQRIWYRNPYRYSFFHPSKLKLVLGT